MESSESFKEQLIRIAVPVALQSLLASSFSIVDKVMVGQLGEAAISGVGVGGQFASIYNFASGAILTAAGIFISQFIGQKNEKSLNQSYYGSLLAGIIVSVVFLVICLAFPAQISQMYIQDPEVITISDEYMRIYAFSFIPQIFVGMYSVFLRCINKASVPLYVMFGSVVLNTFLNACLIFGLFGLPKMGAAGVALASLISICVSWLVMYLLFRKYAKEACYDLHVDFAMSPSQRAQFFKVVIPLFFTELIWVLGENVYSAIYGHLGTSAFSAMQMAVTIIGLVMGALSGLSQAAGIMVGKALGKGDFDQAYAIAWKLIRTGLMGSCIFAVLCALMAPLYVQIYSVSQATKQTTILLLMIFACYTPIKTENMIITGGVIRAGGKTKYTLYLNAFGTWCIGVPLGILCASLHMPISWVYGILSIEEAVRLAIAFVILRRRSWMEKLKEA